MRAKRAEEDQENIKETERDLEKQVDEERQEVQRLEQKLKLASDDLTSAQKELVEQKKSLGAMWMQKLDEERAKWAEQMNNSAYPANSPSPLNPPRTGSPVAYFQRPPLASRDVSGSYSDYRSTSRRSSIPPLGLEIMGLHSRQNSYSGGMFPGPASPVMAFSNPNTLSSPPVAETPTTPHEPDESFPPTPSAYGTQNSRGINGIISESTAGAGPSVQVVERMSAMVRRLETERASFKDEMARISAQRDEARQQVVDLMREAEEKRVVDARAEDLQKQVLGLDQRYQTTLEMLGEKSELVEELRADVSDLKKIYRELVDSTMK